MQQEIIQADSIARLLTLRYNPGKKPLRKQLAASDFEPRGSHDIESAVLEVIKKDLLERHHILQFKQISLSLSGGVDSRFTLAMLRSFLPDVKVNCISVGFGDKDDEIEKAREVARTYDCDFYSMILDNVLTEMPKLISIVKEPRWNLYQFYAFEHGKKTSDVFYTGDGGDELFGGYTFRYQKFMSLLPKSAGWKERAKLYLSCHERDWVPDQESIFGQAVKFSWDRIYQIFRPYFDNNLEPLNQVFLADFNGKLLYDWLPTNIAFSKFLDLKIESILLTDGMVSLATHIPWQKKYDSHKNIGKVVLHSILSKHKSPQSVDVTKKGFSLELVSLWNRNGREIVNKYVNAESEIVKGKIINGKWIETVRKKLGKGSLEHDPRYINKMLGILALEVWHRIFISGTMDRRERL